LIENYLLEGGAFLWSADSRTGDMFSLSDFFEIIEEDTFGIVADKANHFLHFFGIELLAHAFENEHDVFGSDDAVLGDVDHVEGLSYIVLGVLVAVDLVPRCVHREWILECDVFTSFFSAVLFSRPSRSHQIGRTLSGSIDFDGVKYLLFATANFVG
jgi:hypothetical protein